MGTVETINACYDQLSNTEQRAADYMIHNLSKITQLSVREIAKESKTSGATVSRLVRRLGYESFSTLRLSLAAEQSMVDNHSQSLLSAIDPKDIAGSMRYILDHKVDELRATVDQINPKVLEKAIKLVKEADTVYFAAVGNSIPSCSKLAFKLGQIGRRAVCPSNTESMILSSLSLRKTDVLFVVTALGYSRRLETIVDNAEDSGTPIILVTTKPNSAFASRSSVVLSLASRDRLLAGEQFSSQMAADFVLESIFLLILSEGQDAFEHARLEYKSLGKDKESTPAFD